MPPENDEGQLACESSDLPGDEANVPLMRIMLIVPITTYRKARFTRLRTLPSKFFAKRSIPSQLVDGLGPIR